METPPRQSRPLYDGFLTPQARPRRGIAVYELGGRAAPLGRPFSVGGASGNPQAVGTPHASSTGGKARAGRSSLLDASSSSSTLGDGSGSGQSGGRNSGTRRRGYGESPETSVYGLKLTRFWSEGAHSPVRHDNQVHPALSAPGSPARRLQLGASPVHSLRGSPLSSGVHGAPLQRRRAGDVHRGGRARTTLPRSKQEYSEMRPKLRPSPTASPLADSARSMRQHSLQAHGSAPRAPHLLESAGVPAFELDGGGAHRLPYRDTSMGSAAGLLVTDSFDSGSGGGSGSEGEGDSSYSKHDNPGGKQGAGARNASSHSSVVEGDDAFSHLPAEDAKFTQLLRHAAEAIHTVPVLPRAGSHRSLALSQGHGTLILGTRTPQTFGGAHHAEISDGDSWVVGEELARDHRRLSGSSHASSVPSLFAGRRSTSVASSTAGAAGTTAASLRGESLESADEPGVLVQGGASAPAPHGQTVMSGTLRSVASRIGAASSNKFLKAAADIAAAAAAKPAPRSLSKGRVDALLSFESIAKAGVDPFGTKSATSSAVMELVERQVGGPAMARKVLTDSDDVIPSRADATRSAAAGTSAEHDGVDTDSAGARTDDEGSATTDPARASANGPIAGAVAYTTLAPNRASATSSPSGRDAVPQDGPLGTHDAAMGDPLGVEEPAREVEYVPSQSRLMMEKDLRHEQWERRRRANGLPTRAKGGNELSAGAFMTAISAGSVSATGLHASTSSLAMPSALSASLASGAAAAAVVDPPDGLGTGSRSLGSVEYMEARKGRFRGAHDDPPVRRGRSRIVNPSKLATEGKGGLRFRKDIEQRDIAVTRFFQMRSAHVKSSEETQAVLSKAKAIQDAAEKIRLNGGRPLITAAERYELARKQASLASVGRRTTGNAVDELASRTNTGNKADLDEALAFRGNISTIKKPSPFLTDTGRTRQTGPKVIDPKVLYYDSPEPPRPPTPPTPPPPPAPPKKEKKDMFEEADANGAPKFFGARARSGFFEEFKDIAMHSRDMFDPAAPTEVLEFQGEYPTLPDNPLPELTGEISLEDEVQLDEDGEDDLAVRETVHPPHSASRMFMEACRARGVVPEPFIMRKRWTPLLKLGHYGIGEEKAYALVASLPTLPLLQHLDLRDNRLGDEVMVAIMSALELRLTLNDDGTKRDVDKEKQDVLRDAKNDERALTSLDLSENPIGAVSVPAIGSYACKAAHVLKVLKLSHLKMADEDTAALIPLLADANCLQSLDLSYNKMAGASAAQLAELVYYNSHLKRLDVSHNLLQGPAAAKFAESLTDNSVLEYLNLSWNGLDAGTAQALGMSVFTHESLEELDLGHNNIGGAAAQVLGEVIANAPALRKLILTSNNLGRRGARAIIAAVARRGEREAVGSTETSWMDSASTTKFDVELTDTGLEAAIRPAKGAGGGDSGDATFDSSHIRGAYECSMSSPYERFVWSQIVKRATFNKGFKFNNVTLTDALGRSQELTVSRVQDDVVLPAGWRTFDKEERQQFRDSTEGRPVFSLPDGKVWDGISKFSHSDVWRAEVTYEPERVKGWQAMRQGGMMSLLRLVNLKNQEASQKLRMFEAASEDAHLHCLQVHELLQQDFLRECDSMFRLEQLARLLCRVVDPHNASKLIKGNLNVRGRRKLQRVLGDMYPLVFSMPTGHFQFDLNQKAHRSALRRLVEIANDERGARIARCEQGIGPGDTSQNGDWSGFRNVVIDGEPMPSGQSFRMPEIDEAGVVELDYVSSARPPSDAEPLPERKLLRLLSILRLLPRKANTLQFGTRRQSIARGDDTGKKYSVGPSSSVTGRVGGPVERQNADDHQHEFDAIRARRRASDATETSASGAGASSPGTAEVAQSRAPRLESVSHYMRCLRFLERRDIVKVALGGPFVRRFKKDLERSMTVGKFRTSMWRDSAKHERERQRRMSQVLERQDSVGAKARARAEEDRQRHVNEHGAPMHDMSEVGERVTNVMLEVGELGDDKVELVDDVLYSDDSDEGLDGFYDTSPDNDDELLQERLAREAVDAERAKETLRDLACLFSGGVYVTAKQAVRVVNCFPMKLPERRLDAACIMFPRITDLYNFEDVLYLFNEDDRQTLIDRLGILNVMNPLQPDHAFKFDLAQRDHRVAVSILVRLAVVEPGENWEGESYNDIPGWELPASWAEQVPDTGLLTTTYTSTAVGCLPEWEERRALCSHVLLDPTPAAVSSARRKLKKALHKVGRLKALQKAEAKAKAKEEAAMKKAAEDAAKAADDFGYGPIGGGDDYDDDGGGRGSDGDAESATGLSSHTSEGASASADASASASASASGAADDDADIEIDEAVWVDAHDDLDDGASGSADPDDA